MRTGLLALLVLASAVLGPMAVLGLVVLPDLLADALAEELAEAGVIREVRFRAADRVVEGVREETGAPVRRTPALNDVMAEILPEEWFEGAAGAVVGAVRAALEEDAPQEAAIDLREPKDRLAGRWAAVAEALYRSLPDCAPDQEPVEEGTIRCRSAELSAEQAVRLQPGPRLVLRDVPDTARVPVLGGDLLRAPLSLAHRQANLLGSVQLAVLVLLPAAAPVGRRMAWLGWGILFPGLVLVLAGVVLLVLGALLGEGVTGAVLRAVMAVYGPVLLGGAVVMVAGAGLGFRS